MYDLLVAPFADFVFMRSALLGAVLLCLGACPVGVFLMLRRMTLAGDAMAHAILPGAAVGFLLFGLEILPMTLGGIIAGVIVALGAGGVARFTVQREDASMAAFYLISLALGVMIISLRGSSVDLMQVLFGSVLALDPAALSLIASIAVVSLVAVVVFWRALVAECMDPLFFRSASNLGGPVHLFFMALLVLNLVAGFQALGTLLSVGLMVLPATAARFWANRVATLCIVAVLIGMLSSIAGLLLSYHADVPSGPAIVLSAGAIYMASLLLGRRGVFASRFGTARQEIA